MQTRLQPPYKDTAEGRRADAILRSCVHCGFCLATCPTYQLLGDELDSPRGRIYLIKQVLEGETPTARTQNHLDRCLTCRACETTCPSGVQYGQLLDIGRGIVEQQVTRPWRQRWLQRALRWILPYRRRFGVLLRIGQWLKPVLPQPLVRSIPARQRVVRPQLLPQATRRMLLLDGCVQSSATPATNAATARVLSQFGIAAEAVSDAGCCGALDYHLGAHATGLNRMRRNIDAWWPHIEHGIEAIVMTASGCGVTVGDYGQMLADDPAYADKARRVSALTRDLSEVIVKENRATWQGIGQGRRIAYHAPCTLQHGQKLKGVVERVLTEAGFDLTPVANSHLCCGSAGSYSILQPDLSDRLRRAKLDALASGAPETIVTANVGCQLHLNAAAPVAVRHWIELLDEA